MTESVTLRTLSSFWQQAARGVFGKETIDRYSTLLESHVFPWFGDRIDVSRDEVTEFMDSKRASGVPEPTVVTTVKVLRRILLYGAEHGFCPPPDWDTIALEKKSGAVILSPTEESRLITYLTGRPNGLHLCMLLILTTGLTVGEALGAKWEDVSLSRRILRVPAPRVANEASSQSSVRADRKAVRYVAFGERERAYIQHLRSRPEHYLCSGGPKSRTRVTLELRWSKVCDELILPPATLTDLRHTFAVRCLESGMDYGTLATLLGVDNSRYFRTFYRELAPAERERLDREHKASLPGRKGRKGGR